MVWASGVAFKSEEGESLVADTDAALATPEPPPPVGAPGRCEDRLHAWRDGATERCNDPSGCRAGPAPQPTRDWAAESEELLTAWWNSMGDGTNKGPFPGLLQDTAEWVKAYRAAHPTALPHGLNTPEGRR